MRKFLLGALVLAAAFSLSACGDRVRIQTGEVGKQMTTSGLEDEIRLPGSFRLDACWPWSACAQLVRLQSALSTETIVIDTLFLPKSNVDLTGVSFGMQFRVKQGAQFYNEVFQDVPSEPSPENERERVITSAMIYKIYVQRKAPDAVIEALRTYTVDDVLSNVPEIARYTRDRVNLLLKDTPIEVTELGFPNGIGSPPTEVLEAKRQLFAVEEKKARRVKELEAELAVEEQRMAVLRAQANNDIAISKMITEMMGISAEDYLFLRNMETAAEKGTPFALGAPFIPMLGKQ